MLRKLAVGSLFMLFAVTLAMAEEISGNIVGVSGSKITVRIKKDSKEYDTAKDVKVAKMVKKSKEELPDGLKNDIFKNLDSKKGVAATLITNDDGKVTEIILGGKKKKDAK